MFLQVFKNVHEFSREENFLLKMKVIEKYPGEYFEIHVVLANL